VSGADREPGPGPAAAADPEGSGPPVRPAPGPAGYPGIAISLALVTVAVFLPSVWNGFVWDDELNFTANPAYRGLGWRQLAWMATAVHMGHYIPLAWLTFGLDYTLWGMNPAGYHLTNVVLHSVNAVLFYVLSRRVLRRASSLDGPALYAAAGIAALFFAVHPLRAESVAWVTERRDTLSALFFLLTVLAYLAAAEARDRRRRWLLVASVGAYLLALASKSIVMTTPAILVLLDVYPLRRLGPGWRDWFRRPALSVWLEKIPYAVLTLLSAAMAYHAQMVVTTLGTYPWLTRVAAAFFGLWLYVVKTLLPVRLSPLYEIPVPLHPLEPRFLGSFVGVLALTVAALVLRRRWPAGLAVWLFYGIVLAPVSGIAVRAGFQLTADRYSYLAGLGWALLVGGAAGALVRAWRRGALRPWVAGAAVALGVAWFLAMGALTWQQVQVWRSTESLWRHAVAATPECAICRNNLGVSLLRRGAPLEAIEQFREAAAIRPDRSPIYVTNVGLAHAKLGNWDEAVRQYRLVLDGYPDETDVRNALSVALRRQGKPEEALEQLRIGTVVAPNDATAHANLAFALQGDGKFREAAPYFRRAVELRPRATGLRYALVQAYLSSGDRQRARAEYEVLRRLDPQLASRVGAAFGD
jgi:protein O-mannosyl-transferase